MNLKKSILFGIILSFIYLVYIFIIYQLPNQCGDMGCSREWLLIFGSEPFIPILRPILSLTHSQSIGILLYTICSSILYFILGFIIGILVDLLQKKWKKFR